MLVLSLRYTTLLALQFASLYYNRRNAVFLCLCRNTADLLATVERLTERGVVVQFHKEDFKTGKNSPAGNMMLTVLAAVAQMERETMLERQREGYEAAKAAGRITGRGKGRSIDREAIKAELAAGKTIRAIAESHNVSTRTVMNIKAEA
ncbi:recombinase family protein [Enterobacter hormaechei]|nr:recombinase family protein [Enterobacter hormaechei]ELX8427119.1 recombinase family protein [Enterobacter hormaechei subsp. hoffmannii]MBE3441398.1 recombinase family protein [Enterobacter cloacae complex sp. P25RS]MBE4922086.1 recombinase family protein [Enterobacter cloacae complex sp. I1M]HCJ7369066.1 recombinase family protein [Enterobacter hormaechei subsp. xiangfangensis]